MGADQGVDAEGCATRTVDAKGRATWTVDAKGCLPCGGTGCIEAVHRVTPGMLPERAGHGSHNGKAQRAPTDTQSHQATVQRVHTHCITSQYTCTHCVTHTVHSLCHSQYACTRTASHHSTRALTVSLTVRVHTHCITSQYTCTHCVTMWGGSFVMAGRDVASPLATCMDAAALCCTSCSSTSYAPAPIPS